MLVDWGEEIGESLFNRIFLCSAWLSMGALLVSSRCLGLLVFVVVCLFAFPLKFMPSVARVLGEGPSWHCALNGC